MRCLVSPSPPGLSAASLTTRPPSTLPAIWPLGRPAVPSFRCLKLRRGETAALRPRCLAARAQMNHGRNVQLPVEPNHFVEEMNTIIGRSVKISATNEGYLHLEAMTTSACVCGSAAKAVTMASQLVDSASLAAGLSNEISTDTVHRTLQAYVNVFLHTAEDSYNRRFSRDNVMWFLDALRGLASISHILLEDALEALSHTRPRESLSEYAFNCDVKNMHREFNWQIDDLEYVIWNRCRYELVLPTILKGVQGIHSY